MTTQPQPEALPPLPEAEAWVISFDCDMRGFIDAKVWKEGEFTTPLFTADQMRAYATEHAARLHAECEALRMERDALRAAARHDGWVGYIDSDALRADAERYRWLRGEHQRVDPLCHVVWKRNGDRHGSEWVNTAELDAAIDAARAAKEAQCQK